MLTYTDYLNRNKIIKDDVYKANHYEGMPLLDKFYEVNQDEAIRLKRMLEKKYNANLVHIQSDFIGEEINYRNEGRYKVSANYKYHIFCDDKIYFLTIDSTDLKEKDSTILEMIREQTKFVGYDKRVVNYINRFKTGIFKQKLINVLNKYSRNGNYRNISLDFLRQIEALEKSEQQDQQEKVS